ncbi:hypothetical protein AGMMS49546_28170 [Spirochaetia bacterium]|nr:hypothetical protein AGMMS49546_28170 [Spirochaetia bacterium]
MSDQKYVFDSNAFMNMQRHCPPDIFISLWDKIEILVTKGQIFSSDEVLEEIERGNDPLVDWAHSHPSIFLPSDEAVQLKVRDILSKYPKLVQSSKKTNGADPFVISIAAINDCVVVSDEGTGNELAPKIPFVCNAYGVRCIKFNDFLREMRFTL